MWKKVCSGIRTNLKSVSFLLAVLLMALLCGFNELPIDIDNPPTVWIAIFTYSQKELLRYGEWASSYNIIINFRNMEWFMILFPVLVAFPSVYGFADEWMSGNYYMTVSRCGRFGYTLRTLLTVAVTGVLVVLCGVLLYVGIVYLYFPSFETVMEDPETSAIVLWYGETVGERAAVFLKCLWNLSLNAGVAAMVSAVLVAALQDRFFALSLPMIAEYLGMKLDSLYMGFLFGKYGFSGYPAVSMVPELFNPYCQLNMDIIFTNTYGIPYYWYSLYLFMIMGILVAVLYGIVRRRNG